jgi:hypothetical protein
VKPEDLALIQDKNIAFQVRIMVTQNRRGAMWEVLAEKMFGPKDPNRQAVRRIVRELTDECDVNWPDFPN